MTSAPSWIEEFPAAITVTDAKGTILAMNAAAQKVFAQEGGAALLGSDVFTCHPEPALRKARQLYQQQQPNHYTIAKRGKKKIIHQLPWFQGGKFAGFVEISIPIPPALPHFERG